MKKLYILNLFLLFTLFVAAQKQVEEKYHSNKILFQLNTDANSEINAINNQTKESDWLNKFISTFEVIEIERPFERLNSEKLNRTFQVILPEYKREIALEFLQKSEFVEYAELRPLYHSFYTPNDPYHDIQWAMNKIDAEIALNIASGSSNIVIAIVDDAILLQHEDLVNNIWQNPNEVLNGIDSDGNGFIDDITGYDVADDDNNPNPPYYSNNTFSHGTHCAGIAAAQINNNKGVSSIGSGVKIMPVKAKYDNSGGSSIHADMEGVAYAIDQGVDIISMSYGGAPYSTTYQNLFNLANSQGILCIAAAGNDGGSFSNYPANYNGVISVASSEDDDDKSWFSNYGSSIDITAPGTNIYSCTAGSNSSYGYKSGTSMATPMVAGLLALMKSYKPNATNSQLLSCLYSSADNIDFENPNYINDLGAGRINAGAALYCMDPTIPPIPIFTNNPTTCNGFVAFTNNSILFPDNFYWDFGDGTTSTIENPTHQYQLEGVYDVTLVACNTNGCDTIIINSAVEYNSNAAICFQIDLPSNSSLEITTCNGIIYDNGGATNSYMISSNDTLTIHSPVIGSSINLEILEFNTELDFDFLKIHDGPSASSPLLGIFSGNNISGNTTLLTSQGSVTLVFNSDHAIQEPGFKILFESNGNNFPLIANFSSLDTVPHNFPTDFLNISSNSVEWQWDFGDGTTSTDKNPTHSFSSSGIHQVQLISYNCSIVDTVIKDVYVSPPSSYVIIPSNIGGDVYCENDTNLTFHLINTSSGLLPLTISEENPTNWLTLSDTSIILYPNDSLFINYNLNSLGLPTGLYTTNLTINSNVQPNGQLIAPVNMNVIGSSTFLVSDSCLSFNGVVLGTNSTKSITINNDGCSNLELLNFASSNNLFNVVSPIDTIPSNGSIELEIEFNPTQIGLENGIIYVGTNYGIQEICVFGESVANPEISFSPDTIYSNTSCTEVVTLFTTIFNTGGGNLYFSFQDSFYLNGDIILNDNVENILIAPNDSTLINFDLSVSNLSIGEYDFNMSVVSNDTLNSTIFIPIHITVEGNQNAQTNNNCIEIPTTNPGVSSSISIPVYNFGCQSLIINSISGPSYLSYDLNSFIVSANDSQSVEITFSSSILGSNTDTIYFYGNDTTALCIISENIGVPSINITPNPINISVPCIGQETADVTIYSENSSSLIWNVALDPIPNLLSDDFEQGFNSLLWDNYTGSISGLCGSSGSGINALRFNDANDRTAQTNFLNTNGGGTISFDLKISDGTTPCESAETGEDVVLEYSISGNFWYPLGYYTVGNYSAFTPITETIPFLASQNSTSFRWRQVDFSGSNFDNWAIDNVEIQIVNNTYNYSDSGIIAGNDSTTISIPFEAPSNSPGLYSTHLNVISNDPLFTNFSIPVNLTVFGVGVVDIQEDCIEFVDTHLNTEIINTVLVSNTGCDTLLLNNFSSNNSSFYIPNGLDYVIPPNSDINMQFAFAPQIVGAQSGFIYFHHDGITDSICVSGNGLSAPSIVVQPDSVYLDLLCGASDIVPITILNSGTETLYYSAQTEISVVLNDDFETNFNSSIWSSYDGIRNNSCGVFSGSKALTFNGNSRTAITNTFDLSAGGILSFALHISDVASVCDDAEVGEDVILEYSSGGSWNTLAIYSTNAFGNFTPISIPLPAGASQSNTQFRWYQPTNSGAGFDNWAIDDVQILIYNSNNVVSISGNLAPQQIDTVNLNITSNGLPLGTTIAYATIYTNSPSNPTLEIPLYINVQSSEQLSANQTSCLDFDTLQYGESKDLNIQIANNGCLGAVVDYELLSNEYSVISSPNSIPTNSFGTFTIRYEPSNIGTHSDTILIYSTNDSVSVCLNGVSSEPAIAQVNVNAVNVTQSSCENDISSFDIALTNIGIGELYFNALPSAESWINFASVTDSLKTDSTAYFTIEFNGQNLSNNTYTSNLIIETNDPVTSVITIPIYFQIQTPPCANFTSNVTKTCDGLVDFFVSSENPIDNFLWSFGDGNTSLSSNPTHQYTNSGLYNVELIACNTFGCDTTLYLDYIEYQTASSFCDTTQIPNSGNIIINSCTGYIFDNGGANANYIANSDGSITIASSNATNILLEFNEMDIVFNDDFLQVFEGYNTNGTAMLSLTGNNIPNNYLSNTPAVTLRFTSNNTLESLGFNIRYNCVLGNQAPTANFTFNQNNLCENTVLFQDLSTINTNHWLWNFGDGFTSNLQNPLHTYLQPGNYTVTLTASNGNGNNTYNETITIDNVVANISIPDTVFTNEPYSAINQSINAILANWNFGDGNISNEIEPIHTYTTTGLYNVVLVASNNNCSDSTSQQVYVKISTGINEIDHNNIKVYPNPAKDFITIEHGINISNWKIFNVVGQTILSGRIEGKTIKTHINMKNIPSGNYFLQLNSNEDSHTFNIVVVSQNG